MNNHSTYILGNGNLGSHLALLFQDKKLPYQFITTAQISELNSNDILWLCVPDTLIPSFIDIGKEHNLKMVYCSGALALENDWKANVGVWYPLYSFKKGYPVDWKSIPVFTEVEEQDLKAYFSLLKKSLEVESLEINSADRRKRHLAAVFVNNFTNAMLHAAEETLVGLTKEEITEALLPIAIQTVNRWASANASKLQTGPAVRNDEQTIRKHLYDLKDFPLEKELYQSVTNYIIQKIQQK